jgi:thioredoxin 1
MSEYVTEISEGDFDQIVLQSNMPVLVDFWAKWCGPCRALAPVVELVAEHYAGTVHVFKLNVDESAKVTEHYGVYVIPTLILFRDGVEKERIMGAVHQQEISSLIERYISPVRIEGLNHKPENTPSANFSGTLPEHR